MALAPPPPLQIPAAPILALFCFKIEVSAMIILAPDTPRGCPSETAPPFTLTRSFLRFNIFILAKATTENASLISNKSIFPMLKPALSNAFGIAKEGVVNYIQNLLETIQHDLFAKALEYRDTHITEVNSFEEFKEVLETKGGFIAAHWDGTAETEEKIKELTKATIRCIALDRVEEAGSCVFSGKSSIGRVLFAKAY